MKHILVRYLWLSHEGVGYTKITNLKDRLTQTVTYLPLSLKCLAQLILWTTLQNK